MFVDGDPRLRVVCAGSGPPALLVGGWSASWEAWEPTIGELSRHARCIAPDTRGTGWSEPGEAPSMADLVDDLLRVLDAVGVQRCVVAAESIGGIVALNLALRHPDRVAGLCLVATPDGLPPEQAGAWARGARADYRSVVRDFAARCLDEPGTGHLLPWAESVFLGASGEAAARLLEAVAGPLPDVAAVRAPTVVLHGEADHVVPLEAGRRLAAAIPGARLVVLPGAGHAPTVTRPVAVTQAVTGLLPA